MQFVCNNCKAKYEIPAGRIKDRILKIRCRECGSVIEIRGDAILSSGAAAGKVTDKTAKKSTAPTASSSLLKDRFKASFTSGRPLSLSSAMKAKPAQGPPTKADKLLKLAQKAEARALEMKETDKWYVAIRSSPVGPVNKVKIRGYVRKGDLSQSSLVWREGFNDWKPLGTVQELKKLFDELKEEIHRPDQIDIAARLRRAATMAGPGKAPPHPHGGPGPSAAAVDKKEHVELEPLDALATVPPPAPARQEAPQSGSVIDDALRGFYVGRIDAQGSLPGVGSMRPTYTAEQMPLDYPFAEAEEPLLSRLIHSRLFLLLGGASALAAGFAIIIALMIAVEGWDKKNEEIPVVKEEKEPVSEKENVEGGDILAGLIISVEEVLAAEEAEEEENEKLIQGKASGKKKKNTKETVFKTSVMDMPDIEEHSISNSNLKKKATKKASGGGSKGKNGLSDDQIKSTVIKKSKTIQRCYEKVLGKGMGINEKIKVKVKVTVGTSGKVTKVKVTSVTKYGNFLTPCIENGIKTWTFPRSGASSEFIFPVLLTPKS